MFGEPYDGLLVGGILTPVTSIAVLIISTRSADRQWTRQKTIEDENRAVEQVYSPLYFILWDLFYDCAFLSGFFCASLERDFSKGIEKGSPSWLKEYESKGKLSKNMREIVFSKLGFIYPLGLRNDIFYFFKHVESFERDCAHALEDNNAETARERLSLYSWVADFTAAISLGLAETIKKLIDLKGKPIKEQDYRQIFDAKIAGELQGFLSREVSAGLSKEFKAWGEKYGSKLTPSPSKSP